MYKKTHLRNGIPFVSEELSHTHSACMGIWVKAGSRFESPEINGISHFLEHMFFKGTSSRSQKDIAFEIDSLGGDLNAFTSKETTTFYIKVLDEYMERAFDLLSDIFLNSTFPEDEMEREKMIVLEEIRMVEDTPDDYIHDLFSEFTWRGNSLGQKILGTDETVRSFRKETLLSYIDRHYHAGKIVVSAAGNFDRERLEGALNETLGQIEEKAQGNSLVKPLFHPGVRIHEKDHAEVHLLLGTEGIEQSSELRYCILLLNSIIGSGVSSRLFQKIREQRGLAYNVYSFVSSYFDTGLFGVYVGTSPQRYQEVIDVLVDELLGLKESLKEDELSKAKLQLRGNLLLALESTTGRMNNIAKQEIYYGRHYSAEEILQAIDRVSLKEVVELSERLFGSKDRFALTLLGPVKEAAL